MKRILGVLSVAALVLLLAGVVAAVLLYTRPLGPPLNLTTAPQAARSTTTSPASVAQAPATTTCGRRGLMRLLVIGRASPNTSGLYGADSVRLVILNFDAPSAAILALPAPLWVASPVLAPQNIPHTQLALVYQRTWEAAPSNAPDVRTMQATRALAQTIVDNFAWTPDHYITVEDAAFIDSIDQLGGIDVFLAAPVDGTADGYGLYPAGLNHLDGLRTLNFTRLLHPSAQPEPDWWGSLARQDLVLKGMLQALLNWDNLPDLSDIIKAFRKAVITDLSVSQALDVSCTLQTVGSTAALEMVEPPPNLVTIDADGRMIPDVPAIVDLLTQLEAGNAP
jgi:anionic cell wall polymer biosynthesis LytR-Cps2A-Psr (LCP) family protein